MLYNKDNMPNDPATPEVKTSAAPGNSEQTSVNSSTDNSGSPSNQPDEKISISSAELAQLRRDAARSKSIQRRFDALLKNNSGLPEGVDPNDPLALELHKERQGRVQAEQKALKLEVVTKVREILDRPEYNSLPKSTKDLILKNPSALSDADNADEALLDIEDFVQEQ